MNQDTTLLPVSPSDAELAGNAALFFEADRLEAYAYSLLEGDSTSPVSWERFTEAKAFADAKRTEAQEELSRIRGHLINP